MFKVPSFEVLEHNLLFMAEPNPRFAPDEVVRIQLDALKYGDRGIAVTFKFASPSNKRYTGPLDRFTRMMKTSYGLMLNYESVEYDPVKVVGHKAIQRVKLFDTRGNAAVFLFVLSKQTEGACTGCWMTEGMTVIDVIPMTLKSVWSH